MNTKGRWEDDPDAPPSAEELRAASALAEALEKPVGGAKEAELARSVRAAYAPRELEPAALERILRTVAPRSTSRGNVIRVAFGGGLAAALAAAAAVALTLGSHDERTAPGTVTALVERRSSQELFADPFPREGGGSARVDRIASARGRDLRANHFTKWGVR